MWTASDPIFPSIFFHPISPSAVANSGISPLLPRLWKATWQCVCPIPRGPCQGVKSHVLRKWLQVNFPACSLLSSNPLVKHPQNPLPGFCSAPDSICWPILAGLLGAYSLFSVIRPSMSSGRLHWDWTLATGPPPGRGSWGSPRGQGTGRGAGVVLRGEVSAVSSCTRKV